MAFNTFANSSPPWSLTALDQNFSFLGSLSDATAGSALVGYKSTVAGAVGRTLSAKLGETISVKDLGAVGDGVANDTLALQATFDFAKVNGLVVIIPEGVYNYTSLNLDSIVQGLRIVGGSDPSGATNFSKCSTLRCTSSGSGIGISCKSSYGLTFECMAFTYNNAGYTGDLVRTGHSGLATDSSFITVEKCVFSGESVTGASSLFFTDQSIVERVHKCTFKNAAAGIKTGTSYTNMMTVEDCTFQALTAHNVLIDGTTTCQGLYFKGNTFEALVNGKCSGIDLTNTTAFVEGLTVIGNWFGDVTVAGGISWVHTKALGASFAGNFFATAGGGAGDYAIQLDGCQGVSICGGNRFDDKAVNIASACLGVVISGNDIPVGATGINVAAGNQPYVFGNNGVTDQHGGAVRIGGVASPKIVFNPSSGSTKVGNIAQNGDTLFVGGEDGVANAASFAIATGQFYPSTDARAAQTASGIFAGTGVPSNANGNNGDYYFRGDGTKAGNTLIYHKESGAWVAIVTAT